MGKPSKRIGIDVGGTFTHGVVLDEARRVAATACVPTTHRATHGVAEGIVQTLEILLESVDAAEIELVAHSTTQATNAVLEGDVAPVCLVLIVNPAHAAIARSIATEREIVLGESSAIVVHGLLLTTADLPLDAGWIEKFSHAMNDAAVAAFVESQGTDDPTGEYETAVIDALRGCGALANGAYVAGSALSTRLGLKLRAKTAAINAAMIPKMVETAMYTRDAVSRVLPDARLLVMKSDGGVMDIGEMRSRPLNCILSGPAAGASAAVHVSRISDGVFLEVGGTSTDISLVKAGRVRKRAASLGGHPLHLRSLDLRTVAVGGGSLLRRDDRGRARCGPRSAHILDLKYLSFPDDSALSALKEGGALIVDTASHPPHVVIAIGGVRFGVTLTDAANLLGIVPPDDAAYSANPLIVAGFGHAAAVFKTTPAKLARAMIDECLERVVAAVRELAADNEARMDDLVIVGGGGGVHSIAGEVARSLKRPFEVAPYPAVISAVGAAAAVSTFSREVFSAQPTDGEIRLLRNLAVVELEKQGAARDQIRVNLEYDSRTKLLRVEAEGALGFERTDALKGDDAIMARAVALAGAGYRDPEIVYSQGISVAVSLKRSSGGLFGGGAPKLVCMDRFGRSLLTLSGASVELVASDGLASNLRDLIAGKTRYTDGGETAPEVYILSQAGLGNFTSFVTLDELVTAIRASSDEVSGECLVITRRRG